MPVNFKIRENIDEEVGSYPTTSKVSLGAKNMPIVPGEVVELSDAFADYLKNSDCIRYLEETTEPADRTVEYCKEVPGLQKPVMPHEAMAAINAGLYDANYLTPAQAKHRINVNEQDSLTQQLNQPTDQ